MITSIKTAVDKFVTGTSNALARYSAVKRQHQIGAAVTLAAAKWYKIRSHESHSGPVQCSVNVLVPSKTAGIDDLRALKNFEPTSIHIWPMSRSYIKAITGAFLKQGAQQLIGDHSYPNLVKKGGMDEIAATLYWSRILNGLGASLNLGCVVSSNWIYWAERSLHLGASKAGLGSFAMHKECFMSTAQRDWWQSKGREVFGPADCREIATYNKIAHSTLIEGGIIAAHHCSVVGAPRFDLLHKMRDTIASAELPLRQSAKVVFFPCSTRAGYPPQSFENSDSAGESEDWVDVLNLGFEMCRRLAEQRPNIDVLIKIKTGAENLQTFEHWSQSEHLPENIKVEYGGVATGCLSDADGAFGFNTSALLDAVCLGVPIAVFRGGRLKDANPDLMHSYSPVDPIIAEFGGLVSWVDSLRVGLKKSPVLDDHQAQLLEKWVGNSDGKAGDRLANFLLAGSIP